jgi:peptidoglycan/LPS O-acetylase OafA/YrhL
MNTGTLPTQAPAEKKGFIKYIHNFRGVAIIFVVACHLLLDWAPDSGMHFFLDLLFGNGTVLFVFIAGYLFQYLTKQLNYADYLTKKLTNVIIPYLIISTPIILYRLYTNDVPGYITTLNPDFQSWSVLRRLFYFLLHGAHMQPLWFIPMITLFYLSAPVLYYIDKHPKLYLLLIPFAVLSVFVEREPFSDIPKMFVHFISVYLFGMFMSRYKEAYLKWAQKYVLLLSSLLAITLVCNYFFYDKYNNPINYIQKMLFCCFFIYWLWKFDRKVPAFLSKLAEISFGIFFLHYYLILIIKAVFEKLTGRGIPGNLFYWTLDFLLVILGTVLVIFITKKLFPKKSRQLIGC